MEQKIKIILADDHQLVRQGFKALLNDLNFVNLIGEVSDGKQVMNLLRHGTLADVVIMDIDMPVMGGLETLEQIKKTFLGVKVIMLTMLNNKEIIQTSVDKGADGFLFKNASSDELTDAIKKVAQGNKYFASDVALTLLNKTKIPQNASLDLLTDREIEILKLVAEGFSSSEIGQKLYISPRTVDTHRNNIIHKLQVQGVAGLIRFAVQHKLI
jgi:DNA-binding NarL/FixJ family response regulator